MPCWYCGPWLCHYNHCELDSATVLYLLIHELHVCAVCCICSFIQCTYLSFKFRVWNSQWFPFCFCCVKKVTAEIWNENQNFRVVASIDKVVRLYHNYMLTACDQIRVVCCQCPVCWTYLLSLRLTGVHGMHICQKFEWRLKLSALTPKFFRSDVMTSCNFKAVGNPAA